jgi:hypothetical protein
MEFVEALVATQVGWVDDGRIDQLRSKIAELLRVEQREEVRKTLVERGVTSRDFRVVAASVRLLGSGGWSESVDIQLLKHHEPLVRHATLEALATLELGTAHEWHDLLLDDSIYVQRQAQKLFARQVSAGDAVCVEAFRLLLDGEIDAHNARPVIATVAAVGNVDDAIDVLVEKCLLANTQPIEARAICELVRAAKPERLHEWVGRLVHLERLEEAVLLAGTSEVEAGRLAALLGEKGCSDAMVLSLHSRVGMSQSGVDHCLQCLFTEGLISRATALLCSWHVYVPSNVLIRLLDSQPSVSSPWLRNVLSLRGDWCTDEHLSQRLASVLQSGDPWLCMAVWDCIAANSGANNFLTDAAMDALERVREDEQAVAHCWEGLLCALGPTRNARLPQIINWSIGRATPLSAAVGVFCKWDVSTAPVATQHAVTLAVSRCLDEQDDWTCADVAVKWIRKNKGVHPDQETLLQRALSHWARPVRRGARNALCVDGASSDSDSECDDRHLLVVPGSHPVECCD